MPTPSGIMTKRLENSAFFKAEKWKHDKELAQDLLSIP